MHSGFSIYLSRSELEVQVEPDQSILDALEREGIDIDSMCREGICGTCTVTVVSGTVEHRDYVLDDDEKAAGKMQVCVSIPKEGERLELDL